MRTRAHVDEGVVDQHQFVKVELVGEPLSFSLVEDPLVVVVPEETRTDTVLSPTEWSHPSATWSKPLIVATFCFSCISRSVKQWISTLLMHIFPTVSREWCRHVGVCGWYWSKNIHRNVRTKGFLAEHCIVTRWSMLLTSPISGFNVLGWSMYVDI